jgi:hypothetical protein
MVVVGILISLISNDEALIYCVGGFFGALLGLSVLYMLDLLKN